MRQLASVLYPIKHVQRIRASTLNQWRCGSLDICGKFYAVKKTVQFCRADISLAWSLIQRESWFKRHIQSVISDCCLCFLAFQAPTSAELLQSAPWGARCVQDAHAIITNHSVLVMTIEFTGHDSLNYSKEGHRQGKFKSKHKPRRDYGCLADAHGCWPVYCWLDSPVKWDLEGKF